jgi:hypothetical protein
MATPLHDLTKKNVPWVWGPRESEGHRGLVQALLGDTVLTHPRVDEEGWFVDTDASGYALGAVLSQVQDGRERAIHYASKSLTPEQRKYCTTKGELLGAVWALRSFRYYLQGRHCVLRTDHASVRWWRTMKVGMPDVVLRWLQYMSTFDVEVEYRPGQQHGNADGLSRPPAVDCNARGCICVQAYHNVTVAERLAVADGEPDFDSCPGVPAPESRLIAMSGRVLGENNEPDLDDDAEVSVGPQTDPWEQPNSETEPRFCPDSICEPRIDDLLRTEPQIDANLETEPRICNLSKTDPRIGVNSETEPLHTITVERSALINAM